MLCERLTVVLGALSGAHIRERIGGLVAMLVVLVVVSYDNNRSLNLHREHGGG